MFKTGQVPRLRSIVNLIRINHFFTAMNKGDDDICNELIRVGFAVRMPNTLFVIERIKVRVLTKEDILLELLSKSYFVSTNRLEDCHCLDIVSDGTARKATRDDLAQLQKWGCDGIQDVYILITEDGN